MSAQGSVPPSSSSGSGRADSPTRRGLAQDPDDIMDSCLEFMGSFVTKSLRVKYDKWQKLVTAEDSRVCVSI